MSKGWGWGLCFQNIETQEAPIMMIEMETVPDLDLGMEEEEITEEMILEEEMKEEMRVGDLQDHKDGTEDKDLIADKEIWM